MPFSATAARSLAREAEIRPGVGGLTVYARCPKCGQSVILELSNPGARRPAASWAAKKVRELLQGHLRSSCQWTNPQLDRRGIYARFGRHH